MHHIVGRITAISILLTAACTMHRSGSAVGGAVSPLVGEEAEPTARAGIAIVGRGGIAGWEQVTIVDSATARYMTVTRGPCGVTCAPFDSASGVLPEADVAHIYDVIRDEKVFSLGEDYGSCPNCADQPIVTTAVFANNQRKVITSNSEVTPAVLGRVHVAVAEAIRAARTAR